MSLFDAGCYLEEARKDPQAYWAEIAGELEWFSSWDKTMEGGFPDFRFFVGGLSNVAYNCIDRHVRTRPN